MVRTKQPPTMVRVPPDVHGAIKLEAAAEGRTIQAVVEDVLRRHIAKRNAKTGVA